MASTRTWRSAYASDRRLSVDFAFLRHTSEHASAEAPTGS
jgi:hypothetical protein